MKRFAWSLVWLIGCGKSAEAPATAPAPAPEPAPAPSPAPKPPRSLGPGDDLGAGSAAPAAATFAEASGDVDGKMGTERVTLAKDGTLSAGAAKLTVALDKAEPAFEKDYALRIIDLGGERRGVLLASPTEGEEDPPTRYRIFLYRDGALTQIFDKVIGIYGVTQLESATDGTLAYTESGWMACDRGKGKPAVKLQRVTLALDAAGTALAETKRVDTKASQKCDELAACPFVYRLDGAAAPQRQGEILRDVRGREAATVQSLAIGATAGKVALRLTEEKREVTFLDHVYLQVGDAQVAPLACADAKTAPAYCTADGVPLVLRLGDTLDLAFDAPASAAADLVARGYYVPTPTRPFR